ncbi:DUF6879 family protein [Nocardia seriolae]|uniref:DUF6879 family protein n=1 Tax=Nocardia seriolae TaxID=37332 RepID=UPI0034E5904E
MPTRQPSRSPSARGISTVLPLQDEGFDDLLRDCKYEAFHLEVKDTYETPEETEPFRNFLEGRSADDDYGWCAGGSI